MRAILFLLLISCPIISYSSSIFSIDTTLKEEYYLKYDSSLNSDENKEQAINLTFLNSLENAFGKIIASSNDMIISNSTESKNNTISNTSFKSRTKSLVQGKITKVIELFYEKRISEKYVIINGERVKTNTVFNYVRAEFIATESNQPIAFEQEMDDIQKQLNLIGEKIEKNSKDISNVKENIDALNKSGGRIINASTYKELSFNIQNQLTPNIKKEELVFDLINRFPEESKQMLSINSPGGEGFAILYSFYNEWGGFLNITFPKISEVLNPLIENIEKSKYKDQYSIYLFRKLTSLIEAASASQNGQLNNSEEYLKLKVLGDQIISRISEDENFKLLMQYHYYTFLYTKGDRRLYNAKLNTPIGFENEILQIYSQLLSKKTFPYKERIIGQIKKGDEWIIVSGFGMDTKNNLHNSSIALIDQLYFEDLIYQKSINYMTYNYKTMIGIMFKSYIDEGGLNHILKFCLKL